MTMTLDGSGANTIGVPNSAAAQTASGTAVNFTGIPAGVKRITVVLNEVSQGSAAQTLILQIGAGSYTTSGYRSGICYAGVSSTNALNPTAGFGVANGFSASNVLSGVVTLVLLGSNVWVASTSSGLTDSAYGYTGGGSLSLGGTLDRLRITTVGGTATFDSGSINILYE